jgi:hypothetical protein
MRNSNSRRTREEKRKTKENRLVVTAANMLLLDSNPSFFSIAFALACCYRNDHPTAEREERSSNKRGNQDNAGFRDIFFAFLYHRSFYHKSNDRSSGYIYIYIYACMYIYTQIYVYMFARKLFRWWVYRTTI